MLNNRLFFNRERPRDENDGRQKECLLRLEERQDLRFAGGVWACVDENRQLPLLQGNLRQAFAFVGEVAIGIFPVLDGVDSVDEKLARSRPNHDVRQC